MPTCPRCRSNIGEHAAYCMTCGHLLGAEKTAGRGIDDALWASRRGGLDDVPPWLGWLAIALSLIVPLGIFIYSVWAYRRGRRVGVGRESSVDPYQNFGWRLVGWLLVLLVPVLGLYAVIHVPTLCYKQGLRVGARMRAAPTGFTTLPALYGASGFAILAFWGPPILAAVVLSRDTVQTQSSPPGSAPVGPGFIRSTPSPFVPEPALAQPQWNISEVTRDGKKETTLQDGTNLLLLGTTEARLPYSPEGWSLQFVADTNGDGREDAVVAHYTGGAHCCFEYYVFGSEPAGIRLYDTFNLMNAPLQGVEDLDSDTIPEMVGLDDRLAYLSLDVSYAASPFLPLVLCRSAEGKYEECTPRFPELLMQSAEDFEGRLRDAISEGGPWAVEHQRGAALGLLASHLRLGQAEEGWKRVQALCPDCSDWLQANLGALEERLSP